MTKMQDVLENQVTRQLKL